MDFLQKKGGILTRHTRSYTLPAHTRQKKHLQRQKVRQVSVCMCVCRLAVRGSRITLPSSYGQVRAAIITGISCKHKNLKALKIHFYTTHKHTHSSPQSLCETIEKSAFFPLTPVRSCYHASFPGGTTQAGERAPTPRAPYSPLPNSSIIEADIIAGRASSTNIKTPNIKGL